MEENRPIVPLRLQPQPTRRIECAATASASIFCSDQGLWICRQRKGVAYIPTRCGFSLLNWRYDSLVIEGYEHYRVHHGADEWVRGACHINGLESFWSFSKRRLAQFNGITKAMFPIHLKECEFRFNHRKDKAALLRAILDLFYNRL